MSSNISVNKMYAHLDRIVCCHAPITADVFFE